MIIPHTSVKFKFNQESKLWFDIHCDSIIKNFDATFPESGGLLFNNPMHDGAVAFQLSPPAVQVKQFLNDLGLTNTYVHMFVYKVQSKTISVENPHIDAPCMKPLPGRFNVLVYGNENSKMHWWNRDINHPVIQLTDVPNLGKRWQVIGNTATEQFGLIGPPDYSADKLSKFDQTGDFVRTDIVHSIERDGERRLVLSGRIHHPWEEILEKIKNV